jgi:Zn-dependent protease
MLFLPNLSIDWLIVKGILLLVSIPVHEWAHAWMAYQLGDDTAALQGRLTLNPLAHWDLFGTIAMLLGPFGWGKPVPVSPYRLRGNMRAGWALVSFAGPFSNLVLAMLAAIPFRMEWVSFYEVGGPTISLQYVLRELIYINLGLMLFNLIPIPPLDGSRILSWLLPRRWSYRMDQLERYSGPVLMLVLFALSVTGILNFVLAPLMLLMLWALGVY